MFHGLTEERFNKILELAVLSSDKSVEAQASLMAGSAVTNREIRAACEWIRLADLESGENNSEVREQLLLVARFFENGRH